MALGAAVTLFLPVGAAQSSAASPSLAANHVQIGAANVTWLLPAFHVTDLGFDPGGNLVLDGMLLGFESESSAAGSVRAIWGVENWSPSGLVAFADAAQVGAFRFEDTVAGPSAANATFHLERPGYAPVNFVSSIRWATGANASTFSIWPGAAASPVAGDGFNPLELFASWAIVSLCLIFAAAAVMPLLWVYREF
ncbi:MAG: hypothetical protein ACYDDF_12505 [Thermoplasmatota archaeon]